MSKKDRHTERPVIGILAHVDAGKTTLSEAILYRSGAIRRAGRVDNRDAFLDTDAVEKMRGITIYSKQALFPSPDPERDRIYTLLDTPGHADFSAEAERVLSVLDAAVLVISAMDGVTAQVRRIYHLLSHYRVPVFFFINKIDQAEAIGEEERRRAECLSQIARHLTKGAVDFTAGPAAPEVQEEIALAGDREDLLDRVAGGGRIGAEEIRSLIRERKVCPLLCGAALRMRGVDELLALLDEFLPLPGAKEEFAARVFKITRDAAGERETWMKITGGTLSVRQSVPYRPHAEEAACGNGKEDGAEEDPQTEREEKVTQIRVYSGGKYTAVPQAEPGTVCAVTGLAATYAGQGLGAEPDGAAGLIRPVIAWRILRKDAGAGDIFQTYRQLKLLEEEEPMLRLSFDGRKGEILARLMGPIQREILAGKVRDRFGMEIEFARPSVIYRETIASPVEGSGHFEPLRHYAEVHLLLRPSAEGSGITVDSECPTDRLPRQYQTQVIQALERRRHRGVLTGAELTDVRVTLVAGKAHEKHTEGGDFRQAAGRALRQALMHAENVLLEPTYDFVLELPAEHLGHALLDLQNMGAGFSSPEIREGTSGQAAVITGTAPVSELDGYAEALAAYTKGNGLLVCTVGAYRPCRNAEEVIAESGYDPELDLRQPSSSVFCSHGSAVIVPWNEAPERMHVQADRRDAETVPGADTGGSFAETAVRKGAAREEKEPGRQKDLYAAEKELLAIFERTYGPVKRRLPVQEEAVRGRRDTAVSGRESAGKKPKPRPEKEYLLVDGYNMIFAWQDLRELAGQDVKAARDLLMDLLSAYAGSVSRQVICVFDAYKVPGGKEQIYRYHNIDVVFTRQAETADQYIEKTAHELKKRYAVAVATSDAVEQMIIFSAGASRLSAADLLEEILAEKERIRERMAEKKSPSGARLSEALDASGWEKGARRGS